MLKYYLKTYGCQMNVADGEIVDAILLNSHFEKSEDIDNADVILFNTCAIRDKAEKTLLYKLDYITGLKHRNVKKKIIVGILGCMAQRQKEELLQHKHVDFVIGPDEYRRIADIINEIITSSSKVNATTLSLCETYGDITPHYRAGVTAYIPISRGCDNFCAYCIVPYTRGRERSRDIYSILREVKLLQQQGFKDITLLGQNVNGYKYATYNFAKLLDAVASTAKNVRIRFLSSHPKYFNEDIVQIIASHKNICKYIHLPVQSGSNRMLKIMNRNYTREQYLEQIHMMRDILGEDVAISTDIMCGFCGENDDDHKETLSLMEEVKFDYSFTFAYSERQGTYASKHLKDDVDKTTKIKRLNEIIKLQCQHSLEKYQKCIGKTYEVLVEKKSKRDKEEWTGRIDSYKVVVFKNTSNIKPITIGDIVNVKIKTCSSATLKGERV